MHDMVAHEAPASVDKDKKTIILALEDIPPGPVQTELLTNEDVGSLPPGSEIVYVRSVPKESLKRLSSTEALLRLLGVSAIDEINHADAPNASTYFGESEDPALHRFESVHGRDALEIATRLGYRYPGLLKNTILELATTQGVANEVFNPDAPFSQEEAGRILLLNLPPDNTDAKSFQEKLRWGFPFYGSADVTLTYIESIDQYVQQEGDSILSMEYDGRAGRSTIRQSFDLAAQWLLSRLLDPSQDFIEFKNKDPRPGCGMDCQSWRDSAYAYMHADGSRANVKDGIASFDIQVSAFRALKAVARNCTNQVLGYELLSVAEALRKNVIDKFWVQGNRSDGTDGFFALGLDHDPSSGEWRQLQVKASSMASSLGCGLLSKDNPDEKRMIDATIKHLVSPALLAYAGIRTVASDEICYGPNSYHTGSVWPWDTAHVADSLEREGFPYLGWEVRARILRLVTESGAFPEFVSGDSNKITFPNIMAYAWNQKDEILYVHVQPPQPAQGWTISAVHDLKIRSSRFIYYKPPISKEEADLFNGIPSRAVSTHQNLVGF